jgi:twitching motility protein PilT
MKLEELLRIFDAEKASDLHLAAGSPPMLRTLHGMRFISDEPLKSEDTDSIVDSLLEARHRRRLEQKGACQFSHTFGESVFRISVYRSRGQLTLAIRHIPSELPTLKEMEVPAVMEKLMQSRKGLLLLTGPAGSGKTTTLHGLVEYLNGNFHKHIIIIEDPIEYFHAHKKSILNQREVGFDVPSSIEGVRQSLEQDPDVLVIGQIDDLAMAEAALQAAESGHLVLATLNVGGTVHAINWLLDLAPETHRDQMRQRIGSSLIGILSQVLLPPKKGEGSVPAYELMISNPTIQSLIRKNKIEQIINVMHSEKTSGMRLLDDSLYELFEAGRVTKADMLNAAIETVEIETRLQMLRAKEEQKRAFQE